MPHPNPAAEPAQHNHGTAPFHTLLARIQARFEARTGGGVRPLFLTDARNLWSTYLDSFTDPALRQSRNCASCHKFIERFGGLAVVDEDGSIGSAIWDAEDAPEDYAVAMTRLSQSVSGARIASPWVCSDAVLGAPEAGGWRHLALTVPAALRHDGNVITPWQHTAQKREDFRTVMRALDEFTLPMIETAVALLKTDHLYNSERVLGQAEWLHKLHLARASARGHGKAAIVWLAVVQAPAGFCHPRSSMIGTLLADIAAGLAFDAIASRFADKMHPLRYQRPQAAPSAENIAQAEKLFARLGLAPALERRIARLEEIPLVWSPKPEAAAPPASSVFSHLIPKQPAPAPSLDIPAVTMTLERFLRDVAPAANTIEVHMGSGHRGFMVLTTAVHADAPRLFQWEHPFSWYVWHGGAPASQYGLAPGWLPLAGITRLPARWHDSGQRFKHQGDGMILLLADARETRQAGAALFPSLLRSELHAVRSTIEAYSKSAQMAGLSEGNAIGYDLRADSGSYPVSLRVSSAGRAQTYTLDRCD